MNNYIVSISGGKDSTEMLCSMVERGESIAAAVFFDTGWEHPPMYAHLNRLDSWLEKHGAVFKITRLSPRISFDYLLARHEVREKDGSLRRVGYGWPGPFRRWCTAEKRIAIRAYCKTFAPPVVQCIGFAADEQKRIDGYKKREPKRIKYRFPLAEWGITEAQALDRCKARGFDFGGLYDHFRRVSCFCCPLQGMKDLRTLRHHYPEQWRRMLEMEAMLPECDPGRRFDRQTVSGLETRFSTEDVRESMQLKLEVVYG